MKRFLILIVWATAALMLLQGCLPSQNNMPGAQKPEQPPAVEPQKPPVTTPPVKPPVSAPPQKPAENKPPKPKEYANEIFKEVTVQKVNETTFVVKGKARVFEAVISYVIEDGHNELVQGHAQTSAGAPEWGEFQLNLSVEKKNPNSTLTLVLFEISAKDGSRRMELPIPLP